jgi:molybdopterin molybdotransferase
LHGYNNSEEQMADPVIPTQTSCADPEPPQTLRVVEARARILDAAKALTGRERLALRDALGRVLADDVISPVDVPGHTNSAMDGYALSGDDLPGADARDYRVIGNAFAGVPFASTCKPGECVRIMTGAPMPAGTDTVVMQEQILPVSEDAVRIGGGHRPGQNVRQAGEDIPAGGTVLKAGRRITPADLGILASLGFGETAVRRRPRVAFFSTGNELRTIGETLGEGEVYDSNRYSLYGMLKRADVEILDMGVVRDDPESLREAFSNAADMADLVLSSGGVSVGEADYTKTILEELGEMNFWKIAMKPGRPLAFGQLGDALFFGLPGNPVAVMVTFYQFVLPALHFLATGKPYKPFLLQAVCDEKLRKRPGRYEFLRGILDTTADGRLQVSGVGRQGSGILTSMSRGNCFIHLPESCEGVEAGEQVAVEPFLGLL